MNQKEFVKQSILLSISEGLTGTPMIERSIEFVFNGLVDGICPYGKITPEMNLEDRIKEAKSYAGPVVKNYLKKDKDLNGGIKYTPTNPRGPRMTGELKELTSILESLQGREGDDIQGMISNVQGLIELNQKKSETRKILTLEEIQATLSKYNIGG